MCFYIGIEDLAANALIEILQTEKEEMGKHSVTYAELENYGTEVIHYLTNKGEEAVLIFQGKVPVLCYVTILTFSKKQKMAQL